MGPEECREGQRVAIGWVSPGVTDPNGRMNTGAALGSARGPANPLLGLPEKRRGQARKQSPGAN